jgi:hypothetical protein
MLTDYEFWNRVKKLEGKTIYSLTKNRPNLIEEVNEHYVFTANRKTPVLFNGGWGIMESYHMLHSDGFLLVSADNGNTSASYLTMSIILNAVPDECEEANRGLRLKR